MDILRFTMPYPPSINHYYLRTSSGVIIAPRGKKYRHDVCLLLSKYRGICDNRRLGMTINVFPPDKRKRDIDNILKVSIDSMQYAKVFKDDNQIDMLSVIRRDVVKNGELAVWIYECS